MIKKIWEDKELRNFVFSGIVLIIIVVFWLYAFCYDWGLPFEHRRMFKENSIRIDSLQEKIVEMEKKLEILNGKR